MKDLMLLNGNIYTMNPRFPKAEAVAMKHCKVVAMGKNSEVENLGRKDFKVLNLEGKTVLPGLIDCHTHFLSFAHGLGRVNLRGITSFKKISSAIRFHSRKLKPEEWLVGAGWDKNILTDEPTFTKEALDEIWPHAPVALQSKDQHVLWVNSKALKVAGIERGTGDPAGGRIEKHRQTGEPTGLLKEKACWMVWDKVPSPGLETSKELLKQGMRIANSYGLTGIQNHDDPGAHTLFQSLQIDGDLKLRVCFWIPVQDFDSALSLGLMSGFGNEHLKFGGVKLYSDGSLGSQTAFMFEPFEGSEDNFGVEATSEEELTRIVARASRSGIAAAIHSIGDKAVHQSLNALEKALGQDSPGCKLRHRIEHVQLLHPGDVERFRKLGIIASVQPVHLPADIDIAEKYWGKRSQLAYAFNTLLGSGARVVFGSDAPIETLNPWKGIHAAVSRKRIGTQESWYPEERVTVTEAVSAYTGWASYASYDENLKGSIQIGKLADMIILSQDIFLTDPEKIPETKVELTILGGRIVFEA